jgi:hypothetical protein
LYARLRANWPADFMLEPTHKGYRPRVP